MNAIDVWNQLNRDRTLHFRIGGKGRDNSLYEALKTRLGCPPHVGITRYLEHNPHLSALAFLRAMFDLAEPFSQMYQDIYRIMKDHAARRSEEFISIECKIGEEDLILGLEDFLEAKSITTEVSQATLVRDWPWYFLPDIRGVFVSLLGHDLDRLPPNDANPVLDVRTGFSDMDDVLEEIFGLLNWVRNGLEKGTLTGRWSDAYGTLMGYAQAFLSEAHQVDRWDPQLVADAVQSFHRLVDGLPTRMVEETVMLDIMQRFLNLPFWKRRWYIYEIWVSLVTVSMLGDSAHINVGTGGMLPLSSSRPTKIAAFHDRAQVAYDIYAQVGTARANNPGTIKPDIRIVQGDVRDPRTTRVLIECKQRVYRRQAELADNVSRYADGAPESQNIFVNYDRFPVYLPTSPTVLLSEVRPGHIMQFQDTLMRVLDMAGINLRPDFDALLLDVSASMDLTAPAVNVMHEALKDSVFGTFFYFADNLMDTAAGTLEGFLSGAAVAQGASTQLGRALRTLHNRHPDVQTVAIVSDGGFSLLDESEKVWFERTLYLFRHGALQAPILMR